MKFDAIFMDLIQGHLEDNLVPMLLGEPGIGKSSWIKTLAEQMRTKAFVVACNQLADKTDLTGARMIPKPNNPSDFEQYFFPHATISQAIDYAVANPREKPILFLDELNRTTPDVTSALLSISTDHKIGNTELPKNLKIIVAGNDKGNVTSLDTASVTRFQSYHVQPDVGTFLTVNPDLNPFVKAVVTAHPELIFCRPIPVGSATATNDDDEAEYDVEAIIGDDEMVQLTTPRTLTAISRTLNRLPQARILELIGTATIGHDGEPSNLLREVIEAHIGNTMFCGYLVEEISKNIMTNTNAGSSGIAVAVKPNCYDTMKASATVTDLNDCISAMTDNDRSGCMLYALYEKDDNTRFIQALAAQTNNLLPQDMKSLFSLATSDHLEQENVAVLLKTNTPLATQLSVLMNF